MLLSHVPFQATAAVRFVHALVAFETATDGGWGVVASSMFFVNVHLQGFVVVGLKIAFIALKAQGTSFVFAFNVHFQRVLGFSRKVALVALEAFLRDMHRLLVQLEVAVVHGRVAAQVTRISDAFMLGLFVHSQACRTCYRIVTQVAVELLSLMNNADVFLQGNRFLANIITLVAHQQNTRMF